MDDNKIDVTISLFFEIKDSQLFGGVGEVGYSESRIDLYVDDLSNFKLHEYAKEQIKGFAKLCDVREENVRTVSREEYEANTEEE